MQTAKLTTQELRSMVNLLIDHLEKDLGISSIKLTNNFYWNLDIDESFNINEKPEITVGSINDDIDFLRKMSSENKTIDAPSIMFMHLAPIFNSIAQKIRG